MLIPAAVYEEGQCIIFSFPEPQNTPGLTMRPDVETDPGSAPLEMGDKGMMLHVAISFWKLSA